MSTQATIEALWNLPWTVKLPLLGLPAFWLAAFAIYCVRCLIFGLERTPRIDSVSKTPWLPRLIMEFGYWMFRIPVSLCIRLGISANMITLASLVLTTLAAVLIGGGEFALGGWTLLFAFTCDAWDGIVARATKTESARGKFFDATIDRYNDLITYIGFLYYYRNDQLPLYLTLVTMIGSTVMSYVRAKGEAVGVDPNVGYMQRHERAVWLGVFTALSPILAAFIEPGSAHPVHHLSVVAMGILAVMTNITAIWRIVHVMRRLDPPAAPVKESAVLAGKPQPMRARRLLPPRPVFSSFAKNAPASTERG